MDTMKKVQVRFRDKQSLLEFVQSLPEAALIEALAYTQRDMRPESIEIHKNGTDVCPCTAVYEEEIELKIRFTSEWLGQYLEKYGEYTDWHRVK